MDNVVAALRMEGGPDRGLLLVVIDVRSICRRRSSSLTSKRENLLPAGGDNRVDLLTALRGEGQSSVPFGKAPLTFEPAIVVGSRVPADLHEPLGVNPLAGQCILSGLAGGQVDFSAGYNEKLARDSRGFGSWLAVDGHNIAL